MKTTKKKEEFNTNKIKILEEMVKYLKTSCVKTKKDVDYTGLGEYLLMRYEELTSYYNSPDELAILKDLKEKLLGIKNWQLLNYNKELALSICQYLLQQEKNQEQFIIHHPNFHSTRPQKRV